MYFKENWQSMVEKEPAFGHVDLFQTSPNKTTPNPHFISIVGIAVCKLYHTA